MSKPRSRPYRKQKRAQAEEETRLRITEAAVALHGTVGPAQATVTDIAKRAGVSRMTVYNHFPSESDLLMACSSHWAAANPFPDPSEWIHDDPRTRLAVGLRELYTWYGRNQQMLGNVLGDLSSVPALAEVMGRLWVPWMELVLETLAHGWTVDGESRRHLDAMLRLAVDFHTRRLLAESGLDDDEAAALMARAVERAVS